VGVNAARNSARVKRSYLGRFLVTLGTVTGRAKGHATGIMASAARGMSRLGGFVHTGFPIQGCCFRLRKQLIVTDLAITLGTFDVLGMIVGHVPILRLKRQRGRRFLVLSQHQKTAADEAGNHQCSN